MFTARELKKLFVDNNIRGTIYLRRVGGRLEIKLAVPNDKMIEMKNIIVAHNFMPNKIITLPWWSNRIQKVKIRHLKTDRTKMSQH